MNNVEKLEKLSKLRKSGALTEIEFQREKEKVINEKDNFPVKKDKFGLTDNSYNVIIHLSQFCSYIIPFLGIIVPVVLWMQNKDTDPVVDEHGRNVINWNISVLLYLCICVFLMFFIIGFALIWIPLVLSVVFPIIGAYKANEGEVWKYPLSISFL